MTEDKLWTIIKNYKLKYLVDIARENDLQAADCENVDFSKDISYTYSILKLLPCSVARRLNSAVQC